MAAIGRGPLASLPPEGSTAAGPLPARPFAATLTTRPMRTLTSLLLVVLVASFGLARAGDAAPVQDPAPKAQEEKKAEAPAEEPAEWRGEPYTLTTCAASGRPIDVKGTPTTEWFAGRELKFCCAGCAAAVKKDPAKWLEKVDEALIAQQMPIYPTTECIVAGSSLIKDGKDTGTNVMVGNRLFRVCCAKCAAKVEADPAKYAAKLDAMVLEAAKASYPMDVCVVNPKKKLDDKAKAFVVAGRPVMTCCSGCQRKVHSDPMAYLPKIDEALAEARAARAKAAREKAEAAKGAGDGK